MNCAARRDSIHQEVIGAQKKRVFLVEGTDDVSAWQILLNRFVPDWEAHWGIAQAGNKAKLLCLLVFEPDWLTLQALGTDLFTRPSPVIAILL
jgi:hypothetical protein